MAQLNELALFAGIGGGILGGRLLNWRTVCAVENDPFARDVLIARQNDGSLYPFPIWDDVSTFDGACWKGIVDVVHGGFPCQDISPAGSGAGIEGARSGLWSHMARIVGQIRPQYVVMENSQFLVSRGLGMVLTDLAKMGYDARWGIVGAHHASAPHTRNRTYLVAYPKRTRLEGFWSLARESQVAESGHDGSPSHRQAEQWWKVEPDVERMAHGIPARMERLRGIGNAQVPAVVPIAFNLLTDNNTA